MELPRISGDGRLTAPVSQRSETRQPAWMNFGASDDSSQSEDIQMHRFSLRSAVVTGVTTAAALAAVLLGAGPASAAAWPDGAWTGSGTATATVTSDGTSNDPVFDYSTSGNTGTWTFQATAKTARTQPIAYHYKGFHAWYQVSVGLQRFVIHNGVETDTTLKSSGPVNCCAAPSGG